MGEKKKCWHRTGCCRCSFHTFSLKNSRFTLIYFTEMKALDLTEITEKNHYFLAIYLPTNEYTSSSSSPSSSLFFYVFSLLAFSFVLPNKICAVNGIERQQCHCVLKCILFLLFWLFFSSLSHLGLNEWTLRKIFNFARTIYSLVIFHLSSFRFHCKR